ncbi:MAG TPA: EF-Tu/IF-2/RF-3 family GTPase [Nocardioides sp.]|uniref:EF-Tu/IF-2/RF-3 family GTPase n=1 Tax=Nocardioides sp. TaxID=35761 RepID=UPI002E2EAE4C|nr:EF-Tu/IF-2/RF-3 family GTPase [Nocardioides sp.]HEX5088569.1 EF-Tu/IF-2/RF-3 family GTPase [Nocardioides sp.]
MGLWPFGRKKADDMSVETLLEQANAASPTGHDPGAAPVVAAPVVGDGTFRMPVEDVFSIRNRGTVVTGRIESGTVRVGAQVDVIRDGSVAATTRVTGVEMFRKVLDSAGAGDNVGLLLEGLDKEQLRQGDVIQGQPTQGES